MRPPKRLWLSLSVLGILLAGLIPAAQTRRVDDRAVAWQDSSAP
jgi:hypothetical protein